MNNHCWICKEHQNRVMQSRHRTRCSRDEDSKDKRKGRNKKKAEWNVVLLLWVLFSRQVNHLFHSECHFSSARNLTSTEHLESIFVSQITFCPKLKASTDDLPVDMQCQCLGEQLPLDRKIKSSVFFSLSLSFPFVVISEPRQLSSSV